MSLFHALVLGLVQGLTEFIPISSDGHLLLVPFIFGWDTPSLAYVVAVHIGTLVAVTYVFKARVEVLIRTAIGWKSASESDRRLLRLVAFATVPAAIVGFLLETVIGDLDSPVLASWLLGINGYFLLSTQTIADERENQQGRSHAEITDRDAIGVGLAQTVAILPGISRSGSTIGTGMRLGLSREAAAQFSFLMSIPIIFGAILAELPSMFNESASTGVGAFVIGIVASGVSGFFAVGWFLRLLTHRGLKPFGAYCLFAMVIGLITGLARG